MKKIILLLSVVLLASCSRVQTVSYKIEFVKSGTVMVVQSNEDKASYGGVYSIGDTVYVDPILREVKTTSYSSKAVIIERY